MNMGDFVGAETCCWWECVGGGAGGGVDENQLLILSVIGDCNCLFVGFFSFFQYISMYSDSLARAKICKLAVVIGGDVVFITLVK